MLKEVTLLGVLSLFVLTVSAGTYKGTDTRQIGTNDPLRTDGTCLSDEQTTFYLNHYFSIEYVENLWGGKYEYKTTGSFWNRKFVAPDRVAEGEVIIVEVNDHWKGVKAQEGSNISESTVSSLFDQVKFGVKKIKEVTNSVKTPSGTIYSVDLTTNRYFFAKRRSTKKSDVDYLSLRWYDEWSTVKNEQGGWLELESSYAELQHGDPQTAPHNCDSSLELNHFTVLNKDGTGTTEAITTFLYIPDVGNDNVNSPDYAVPYQFFYRATLEGKSKPGLNVADRPVYDVDLKWLTSFDKDVNQFPALKNTQYYDENFANGIREYYDIWRIMPDGKPERIVTGLTTLEQIYTDSGLPVEELGYDVEYYVVSNVCIVDDNGVQGAQVASVATNRISVHIPGSEAFELKIFGNTQSEYILKNVINTSVNRQVATLKGNASVNSPSLVVGDVLNLIRTANGIHGTTVQSVNVTGIDESGKITYTLTTLQKDGTNKVTANLTAESKEAVIEKVTYYIDDFEAPAGTEVDVSYQLVLSRQANNYTSNIVSIPSYRTDVKIQKRHRSGVPDEGTCDPKEIFRNEIIFTPIAGGEIASYFIIRNGVGVAKISQPTDATGTQYAITLPGGAQNSFNVAGGFMTVNNEGQLVYVDNVVNDTPINSGETVTAVSERDFIYTVVIKLVNQSTYGNNDVLVTYDGDKSELVVNVTFQKAEFGYWAWEGRFTSHLTWEHFDHSSEDVQHGNLIGYKIYYREDGSEVFKELTQSTIFNESHESGKLTYTVEPGLPVELGPETTSYLDDYYWDGNKSKGLLWGDEGYITAPREYYVKAIFSEDLNVVQNLREKNSDLVQPAPDNIHTIVEEVEVVNVSVYPNPTSEYVTVQNPAGINSVVLFNSQGAAVMNMAGAVETEKTLSLDSLPSGIYFIAVNGGEPVKLIVK